MSTYQFTKPFYTIAEVGTMLSISRSTVNRLVREGVLTKFSLGANSVRVTTDSLQAFLSKRMMSSQMCS
jgi:excisionase family DNA binding protein